MGPAGDSRGSKGPIWVRQVDGSRIMGGTTTAEGLTYYDIVLLDYRHDAPHAMEVECGWQRKR